MIIMGLNNGMALEIQFVLLIQINYELVKQGSAECYSSRLDAPDCPKINPI